MLDVDTDTLETSVTEDEMLLGAKTTIAIGAAGRWELITYKTAELQGDGSYILSGLLRGRLGSDHAMNSHTATDQVIVIDNALFRYSLPTTDIGVSYKYKTSSSVTTAVIDDFASTGEALMCISPVHENISIDSTTSDITISWIRRARFYGEWIDSIDVPYIETTENYKLLIYDDAVGTTLKRTVNVSASTNYNYTSAQQVSDFGSNQTQIYVDFLQVSDTRGDGYHSGIKTLAG